MAPCTFRFRGSPCPRQHEIILKQGEQGEIASWIGQHNINWAVSGAPLCLIDYAFAVHLVYRDRAWDRHVTGGGSTWTGTVTEFPTVNVTGPSQADCLHALDAAIAQALHDLAMAGQPIPDPIGG